MTRRDKQIHPVIESLHDPGYSIMPLILLLIMASMATIAAIAYVSFQQLDRVAHDSMRARIAAAFEVEKSRLEDLNREYSFWDQAHERLVAEQDAAWADENIGGYLANTYGIGLSASISRNGRPLLGFNEGKPVSAEHLRRHAQVAKALLLAEWQASKSKLGIVSGYLTVDGDIFMVAVALFLDEQTEQPVGDGSMLLLAKQIDQEWLDDLSLTYQLPMLRMVPGKPEVAHSVMTLSDYNGGPVSFLSWTIAPPSGDLKSMLVWPSLAVFVVFVAITVVIFRRDQAQRREHLRDLKLIAGKDFLTGISNRREFCDLANREFNRARRDQQALCLVLFDIDNFKVINDTHGHEVGDRILTRIADLVYEDLREFDLFARWGGEEFIVLLPRAELPEGMETAERIRRLIEAGAGTELQEPCTVSIGVALWDREESIDHLVGRADKSLYDAKMAGKNTTRSAVN